MKRRSSERPYPSLSIPLPSAGATFVILLWVALWAAINAGPWFLNAYPSGLTRWINALRAAIPILLPFLWLLGLGLRRHRARRPGLAEMMWISYALLSLLPVVEIANGFAVAYWAFAYLGVFAAMDWSLGGDSLARARSLNRINWTLATAVLLMMLFFARDVLLVQGPTGLTAYGVVNRVETDGFGPISRSSGLARLAIVPAVVGLVLAVGSGRSGAARLFWWATALSAMSMIWLFQSRQGIFGAGAALGFVLLLLGGRLRSVGIVLMLVGIAFLGIGLIPEQWLDYVVAHATRLEGRHAFESMSGRDVIWRMCWRVVEESPLFGYGPQADRRLLGLNAQNGPLYATMSAGMIGGALYLGGLIWGWVLLLRLIRRGLARRGEERLFLIQVAGIMTYLSLRNIPENASALYSVDLLLFAPMLAYLAVLDHHTRRRQRTAAIENEPRTAALASRRE